MKPSILQYYSRVGVIKPNINQRREITKHNFAFGRLFFIRLPALFAIMIGTLGVGVSFNTSADCAGYVVQRYYMDNDAADTLMFIRNPVTGHQRAVLVSSGDGTYSTTALRAALMDLYLSQKPATFVTGSTNCGAYLVGVVVGSVAGLP